MTVAKILKLITILEKIYNIYQEIYALGEEKKDFIIGQEIELLEETVQKEESLLSKITKLEEKRIELVGERSLSELMDNLDSNYGEKLNDIKSKLTKLVVDLDGLNQLNNQLIKDSLYLINLNLNLFNKNRDQGTYGKKGRLSKQNNGNSFINHRA